MIFRKALTLALVLALALSAPAAAASSRVGQVLSVAVNQLGTPYELASHAPDSFNCLTFVMYCFNQADYGGITESGIQGKYRRIRSARSLKPGDIVCFRNTKKEIGILGYHFGIYLGKGYFIHASSGAGKVLASKLKDYKKRFLGAVRLL